MQNSFEESVGICLVCAGHSEGSCFCSSLFDDKPNHHEFISKSQEHTAPEPPTQLPTDALQAHQSYRRLKKDNIAHKRFSTILKNIYVKVLGTKLDQKIQKHYHRKDFFVMILSQMERYGVLKEAKDLYAQKVENFEKKIEQKHRDEPEYLKLLKSLIKIHFLAFEKFLGHEVSESIKILFNQKEMRQKEKLRESLKLIFEMRKKMGLPFQ